MGRAGTSTCATAARLAPDVVFALRMGDSALVLGHRLSQWSGHAPVLEEELAMANVGLDLIGQAQRWLKLAGEREGAGRDADALAYLRDVHHYRNFLLTEQLNGDFAMTIVRGLLFDVWHQMELEALGEAGDGEIAELALKAQKEVRYHVERSCEWTLRLGDGTHESHRRAQLAVDELWGYSGELFASDDVRTELIAAGKVPAAASRDIWRQRIGAVLSEATLQMPEDGWMPSGGIDGNHGEHLGFLLAELQFLQRAYPGAKW
jgi:ring-1,2-phenylacetyl-CoA epoxidase subunit PaaC